LSAKVAHFDRFSSYRLGERESEPQMREFVQGEKGERGRKNCERGDYRREGGEGVIAIGVGKEGNREGVDGGGKVGITSVREEGVADKRS
jgi:hypothetical protein